MAKHPLIANKALRYAGQSIAKDGSFSARDARDAHLLTITRVARAAGRVEAPPVAAPVVLTKEMTPVEPTPAPAVVQADAPVAVHEPVSAPATEDPATEDPQPEAVTPPPAPPVPPPSGPMRASTMRGPRGGGYKRSEH